MPKCKSCGAEIIWATTVKNYRSIPLNAEPEKRVVLRNTLALQGGRMAEVVDTYVSHFTTCPQATEHRRKE